MPTILKKNIFPCRFLHFVIKSENPTQRGALAQAHEAASAESSSFKVSHTYVERLRQLFVSEKVMPLTKYCRNALQVDILT